MAALGKRRGFRAKLWSRYLRDHDNISLRNQLVEANYRLVPAAAKVYRTYLTKEQYEDVLQEGCIGLIRAVELFDPGKNATFGTYAWLWIKQKMARYLENHGETIRVPVHNHDLRKKVHKAEGSLSDSLGRRPTNSELANHMGITEQQLEDAREKSSARITFSLDRPFSDDNGNNLYAMIPSDPFSNPLEILLSKEGPEEVDREVLISALDSLPERIRSILILSANDHTLGDIASRFGISAERVRQICVEGITALRIKLGVVTDAPARSPRASAIGYGDHGRPSKKVSAPPAQIQKGSEAEPKRPSRKKLERVRGKRPITVIRKAILVFDEKGRQSRYPASRDEIAVFEALESVTAHTVGTELIEHVALHLQMSTRTVQECFRLLERKGVMEGLVSKNPKKLVRIDTEATKRTRSRTLNEALRRKNALYDQFGEELAAENLIC